MPLKLPESSLFSYLKDKFTSIYRYIRHKNKERITLMVIPHKESKIFSIQLSKIHITFLTIILSLVLISSTFSIYQKNRVSDKVENLTGTELLLDNRYIVLSEYHRLLQDYLEEMESTVVSVYRKLGLQEYSDNLFYSDTEHSLINNVKYQEKTQLLTKYLMLLSKDKARMSILNKDSKEFVEHYIDTKQHLSYTYSDEVLDYQNVNIDLLQFESIFTCFLVAFSTQERVLRYSPFQWPLQGGHITSYYGVRLSPYDNYKEFHSGLDMASPTGTPVYATASGRVISARYSSGYGLLVVLEHDYGYTSKYAHLNSIYVKWGEHINQGDTIGRVGSTGRSTGPHLHYEITISGESINPLNYILTKE